MLDIFLIILASLSPLTSLTPLLRAAHKRYCSGHLKRDDAHEHVRDLPTGFPCPKHRLRLHNFYLEPNREDFTDAVVGCHAYIDVVGAGVAVHRLDASGKYVGLL